MTTIRDYSLVGPENRRAVERGLASAEWYQTPVPRERMRELMQRRDGPAIRDTLLWLGFMVLFAWIGVAMWFSAWSLLAFFAYGALYGSASDSRWHECGHRTAFRSQWMNDVVYQIACFMIMRSPEVWRWSHTRHHTDTIVVGRDPEIVAMRPPALGRIALNFFGLLDVPLAFASMFRHASGRLTPDEATYVPETEQPKVARVARVWLVIYAATVAACVVTRSILPAMVIGLPRFYGAWHHLMTGLMQHGGLADDVLDHRLNTRTVCLNPISRFLYLDMQFHIEHHMFPNVPYHRLKDLHEEIKDDCPPPSRGIIAAYREILPMMLAQRRHPERFIERMLPAPQRLVESPVESVGGDLAVDAAPQSPGDPGSWIAVCRTDEVPHEDVIAVSVAGTPIAVYHAPDGSFFATHGLCTHEQVELADGLVDGHIVECPKHNGRFDYRTGEGQGPPICEHLRTYRVRVEDDTVFVDLG